MDRSSYTAPTSFFPILSSPSSSDFDWPTLNNLAASQDTHENDRKGGFLLNDNDLFVNKSESIWIPDDDADLQLCLCIIAHIGPSEHRAAAATFEILRQHFR